MKIISIRTAIGLTIITSIASATSVFADGESRKIESKKVSLSNVLPWAFDCFSYENGYSNSKWSLDSVLGLPENTIFKRSDLTSWGWAEESMVDSQRCKLVEELKQFLQNNSGKIDADLTIDTSTRKREYWACGGSIYTGCAGRPGKWICATDVVETLEITFSNKLVFKDFNSQIATFEVDGKCS